MEQGKKSINLSEAETLKLIHELEVHKVELEVRNEELIHAKEQSERAFRRFTELFDFAPTGYFTLSKEGDIIEINIYGSQMLGKDRKALHNSRFGFFVSDDTKPIFNLFLNMIFKNKGKETCEVILSADENPLLWVQLTGCVTKEGDQCLICGVDITERKHLEDQLREREEWFRTLHENATIGLYRTTPDGRILFANPAMVRMLGYSSFEELSTRNLQKSGFESSSPRNQFLELINKEGEVMGLESAWTRKDDTLIYIRESARAFKDLQGEILYYDGAVEDITEGRKAEQDFERKNEELLKVVAEKDKFFSIIAHDLRSPFQTLLGFTRLMVENLPTLTLDEIQKIAMSMRNSANKLFNLLENLLEWSQMHRGLTSFKLQSFLLLNGITPIIELVRESAEKKLIRIDFDVPEDLRVTADAQMFDSIIRNLVTNAIKFTPQSGKITISAKSISDEIVEISVQDTGVGMNNKMLDQLFRLDKLATCKGTEGEPGSGLGLIICKDFIEKHNGTLRVESEEGKGSIFSFSLKS
jgi:PAS domain S-box-containing protein